MNIFIDIETVPSQSEQVKSDIRASIQAPGQYKKTESIKEWMDANAEGEAEAQLLKTSFDGGLGMIACIGIAIEDQEARSFYSSDWPNDEKTVIRSAFDFLVSSITEPIKHSHAHIEREITFVGYNHIGFDLPFLKKRCVVLGIKPPSLIPFTSKPWDKTVYDTMLNWDSKNFVGMDKLCKILGIEGKGEISGADVWPLVKAGKIADVAEYCKGDVNRTRAIFNRMTFA